MKYFVYPLNLFKQKYLKELNQAQKEIYPDEEVAQLSDEIPFEKNAIAVFAVDQDKLAGFCAIVIGKEGRNKSLSGSNAYFYVFPDYRKTFVGGRLILYAEDVAKAVGCDYFKWDVNVQSNLVEAFEKRKSYRKESIIYSKNLV